MRRQAIDVGPRADAALAGILMMVLASFFGAPARAASKPPVFLRSCSIEPPSPTPLFSGPIRAAKDRAADDEEADDDEDDIPRGFVSPGSGTCIAVSGTVNAGLQRDDYHASALVRATGQVPPSTTSLPLTTTFRIETGQSVGDGRYLSSAFEFSVDINSGGSSDLSIGEASVTFGEFVFGLAGSRFDFWAGDDFAFIGRIPSRTVALIGYNSQLTEQLSLSLSAEEVFADRNLASSGAGRQLPDGILRLLYENGALSVHGAFALREVPRPANESLIGRAAVLGVTWKGKLRAQPLTLTAQLAGATNAAPYIGSRLDQRTVLPLLGGDATTRGWSGVVSVGRGWTDEWSTNAYVSRYELKVPQLAGLVGRIRVDRAAANVVWAPIDGLRLGLEGSLAWQQIDLASNARAAGLSGRQSSAQIFLERTF